MTPEEWAARVHALRHEAYRISQAPRSADPAKDAMLEAADTLEQLPTRVRAIAERFYNSNLGTGQRGYRICLFCHGMASWEPTTDVHRMTAHVGDCAVAELEALAEEK